MTMVALIAAYGGAVVKLTNQTFEAIATDPATATAGYRLDNAGVAYTGENGTYSAISGEWLSGGSAGDYECFVTVNSGTLTSGPTGGWTSLSATQTWTLARTTNGSSNVNFTIQIRPVGGSVVATATIDMTATREV